MNQTQFLWSIAKSSRCGSGPDHLIIGQLVNFSAVTVVQVFRIPLAVFDLRMTVLY